MKYLFLFGPFVLMASVAFAATCPSVEDIKNKTLDPGWKFYDSEDGQLLSETRLTYLRDHVDKFILAEWPSKNNSTGTIHCYYRDRDGSDFEAFLAKNHFILSHVNQYWYPVTDNMQCAARADQCEFQTIRNTQLKA